MQAETPIGQAWLAERQHHTPEDLAKESEELFDRTMRMYALARLLLGDANIAATTALQVKAVDVFFVCVCVCVYVCVCVCVCVCDRLTD